MSRSRRVLAIGGKQRILRLDMVCIETILFHLEIVNEYDQEIPQSQTADNPVAP